MSRMNGKKTHTHLDLLSIPQSWGKMSKRLGGIIDCKYKIGWDRRLQIQNLFMAC